VIRNIFSNWLSVAINLAVAFLLSPFLVHSLGDSRYGLWVLVLSVTGYMGLLDTGLRVSVVKHTASCNARGDTEELNRILVTALSLYGGLSILVLLLSALASAFFGQLFSVAAADIPTGRILAFIAGINVALSLPLGIFGGLLAGLQRYDLLTKAGIVVLLARTAAIVAAIWSGFGLIALGCIHVASQILTGVLLVRMARTQFPELDLTPRRLEGAVIRTLYSYSGYIVLNNAAIFLLFYSGEVLIGIFIGTAAVTAYAIARSLVQYLSAFIGSMTQVFHPYASDQHERGNEGAVGEALIFGTKTSLLIVLPIAVAYLVIGPTFISLWIGPEYGKSAGLLLALLTVQQIVWLSQSTAGNILLGVGRHRMVTWVNLLTGIAGIALSVALVRTFGAVGVAMGTLIPILVSQAVILPVWTARALKISLKGYVAGAYLGPTAAVLPFAVVYLIISRVWPPAHLATIAVQLLACLTTFLPAAYFLGFTRSERQVWLARLRPSRPIIDPEIT
jgi:O-antigen/teichoic acid export membrane protein